MKLLLDTHIWIWSLVEPERLAPRLRRALKSRRNELWLSSISVWEAALLIRRGRLAVDRGPEDWVAAALAAAPLEEAPVSHEIALAAGGVELPHRDPADRFLVATARVLDLKLVTADERILHAAPCPLLGNG